MEQYVRVFPLDNKKLTFNFSLHKKIMKTEQGRHTIVLHPVTLCCNFRKIYGVVLWLSYKPARMLEEPILWNRFLGSLKVKNYRFLAWRLRKVEMSSMMAVYSIIHISGNCGSTEHFKRTGILLFWFIFLTHFWLKMNGFKFEISGLLFSWIFCVQNL